AVRFHQLFKQSLQPLNPSTLSRIFEKTIFLQIALIATERSVGHEHSRSDAELKPPNERARTLTCAAIGRNFKPCPTRKPTGLGVSLLRFVRHLRGTIRSSGCFVSRSDKQILYAPLIVYFFGLRRVMCIR